MQNRKFMVILSVVFSFVFVMPVFSNDLATDADIDRLKVDLREGRLKIGQTRLSDVVLLYGKSESIKNSSKKTTYEYGDVKLEFEKVRYFRDWETDGFKQRLYTDDVDDLREALRNNELAGESITYKKIKKEYDDPTEIQEGDGDGEKSIYYWGDLKLIFENQSVLQSWNAKSLLTEAEVNAGLVGEAGSLVSQASTAAAEN